MRLIGSIENEKDGKRFSAFLHKKRIDNQCDVVLNTDWGSENYGTPLANIWIVDEDQVGEASRLLEAFRQNPEDPQFEVNASPAEILTDVSASKPSSRFQAQSVPGIARRVKQPFGPITLYLVLVCGWLFLWGKVTTPHIEEFPAIFPATPILSPHINKELFYDYPETFVLVDKLVRLYGFEKIQNPSELPPEGQYLFVKYLQTPYWHGLYSKILAYWMNSEETSEAWPPMFEKIRQGEIWRLLTPCLLHQDIFHILFNMIWLVVLGKQMEMRLGAFRYLFFIVLTGVFSNTAQYLMGGANFIGISGVLCAMLTFIWMRQQIAPWEGYEMQKATFGLMMIFILAMFAIQITSFFVEVGWHRTLSPGIANTAHLSGAVIGLALGRFNIFGWKTG